MRLALYSDLHLELALWEPPAIDVDVVILAGDIGNHTHGIEWAAKAFTHVPDVLYVAGNHEYYGAHLGLIDELQKPFWEQLGVQFLERRSLEIEGVRFLGCTLWSGFDLYGKDKAEVCMNAAQRSINDYRKISAHNGKQLEPSDTLQLHRAAVRWLDAELSKQFDGKTVVITHFAPHPCCVAPQYHGSDVTPYFVTDLSRLMEKYCIDLWCYGHTHTNCDFLAENDCRVVSNQLGYTGERTRPDTRFRRDLVITL